jgi:hypothetical protein
VVVVVLFLEMFFIGKYIKIIYIFFKIISIKNYI